MAKRLFLLFISSFIGIFAAPEVLMASDSYTLNGVDDSKTVETVIVEPVVEEQPAQAETYVDPTPTTPAPTPAPAPAPAPVQQVANYTVTVYKNTAAEYNASATSLSYSDIYKYKKMIYGHNTWNLLGSLNDRYIGEVFTITEGGVTRNYKVMDKRVYRKTEDGNLENNKEIMKDISNGRSGGATYDVALLTCYGQSLGNGDATHRLVIFANAI